MGEEHKSESDFPMNRSYLLGEHQSWRALPDFSSQEVSIVERPSQWHGSESAISRSGTTQQFPREYV
jgi:hypothetical protein